MNIDELRSAQSKERQKSDLQQLRESFYADVASYVEDLEAERESAAAAAADPFGSPAVQQLTNDIETAKDTAEAIYERRLGKIVKKASLVAAEMATPNDVNGLTEEEQALFEDLVTRIEENKVHMLDVIAGDAEPGAAGLPGSDATASGAAETTASDATAATSSDSAGSVGVGSEQSGERTDASPASSSDGDAGVPHPEDGLEEDRPEVDGDEGGAEVPPDASEVSAADLMGGDGASDRDEPVGNDDDGGRDGAAPDGDGARSDGGAKTGTTGGGTPGGAGGGSAAVDDPAAADAPAAGDAAERATLRVTKDVGSIFGVDQREYTLSAEDVVTLPEENADVLVAQDAAERLD